MGGKWQERIKKLAKSLENENSNVIEVEPILRKKIRSFTEIPIFDDSGSYILEVDPSEPEVSDIKFKIHGQKKMNWQEAEEGKLEYLRLESTYDNLNEWQIGN